MNYLAPISQLWLFQNNLNHIAQFLLILKKMNAYKLAAEVLHETFLELSFVIIPKAIIYWAWFHWFAPFLFWT